VAQAAELRKRPPEPPHSCTARNGSGNVWRELLRIVHPDIYSDVGLFVWCTALHEGGCSFGHSLTSNTTDSKTSEGSRVMARKRYGGGYKGRVGTRRRMRARNRGYGGSPKTAGRAKGRMAHDWTVGKWR
jgi:hypothetical protein